MLYILGAIVLLGFLIVMVRGANAPGSSIDAEEISIKASQVQQYAGELERAVKYLMQSGMSESDIRFAHPNSVSAYGDITINPQYQVFDQRGGAAEYRVPPTGINDGSKWQFFATTHIHDIGTDTPASSRAELLAVLPNVTEAFCTRINELNGQTLNLALNQDPSANGCVNSTGNEFVGVFGDGVGANTIDDSLFTKMPPAQACVHCQSGGFHFYHVVLGR